MNWRKRNGKPHTSTVNTEYNEFQEILRDATLGQKIRLLPDVERDIVLKILERFLND